MLKLKPIYLCLISGALLVLAWPPLPTAFLLFFALAPLFIIHHQLENSRRKHFKFWFWVYLSLLIFNTGTTWWVWNASPSGCVMMLVLNSLAMSLPFLAFSLCRTVLPKIAWLFLVLFYLTFEYWHFNWSASWPWMTLGKGFASTPWYIQWYEYTGELGGSALVLITNIVIARILVQGSYKKLWQPALIILVPALFSFWRTGFLEKRYAVEKKKVLPLECIISQPNIDPYTEKFDPGSDYYLYPEIQIEYAIEPAKPFLTGSTDILLMPETAIVGLNDEAQLNKSELLKPLLQMTDSSRLYVLSGAESFSIFREKKRPSLTARYDSLGSFWYDSYNTALLMENGKVGSIYHKAKLVPGVEKMPFAFLEWMSLKLGGTSGSLGMSDKPVNFKLRDGIKIAPLICYESVFGDYTNEFVRDGANVLAVVTNDGWWSNTPGYVQHLMLGTVRCIETRREMIRSANTGVSAKVDRFGRITQSTKYDERTAFKCTAEPHWDLTFYVRNGNIIGKASLASILILIIALVKGVILWKSKRSVNSKR